MIDVSEQRLLQEFPDFKPKVRFAAMQPLFLLRITASVLEYHALSVIARFMLRLVALGESTLPAIARLLGLEEADLIDAGVELSQAGLIEEGAIDGAGRRRLLITQQGRAYLEEQRSVTVPRKRVFRLHFDPLTREFRPYRSDAVRPETFRRDGLYVIPHGGPRPSRGDVELQKLREAVRAEGYGADEFEIVRVLGIGTPVAEYLPNVQVFVIEHRQTGEERVAAISGAEYLPTVSEMLEEQHRSGRLSIPADAEQAEPEPMTLDVRALFPAAVADTVEHVIAKDRERHDLRYEIARKEAERATTQNHAERVALEAEMAQLQQQLAQILAELEAERERVREATEGGLTILSTEQHRPILKEALESAEEELIIISPWMNIRTVDDDLAKLIGEALRRGVTIRIGYGIGAETNRGKAEKNAADVRKVTEKIRQHSSAEERQRLKMVDIAGTHEKILVCDRSFSVTGSFNWLSYRGERDSGFRREMGTLLRHPAHVKMVVEKALDAFREAEERRRAVGAPRGPMSQTSTLPGSR